MPFIQIVLIALALAMDASTVSLSAATSGFADQRRATFRLAFHFGLFQFLMPVLGWAVGLTIVHLIEAIDHWLAFGLLSFVGGRMIRDALHHKPLELRADPTRGLRLIGLSLATSLDALAVGLSLAFMNVNIWTVSLTIGLVTGLSCMLSIRLGRFLHSRREWVMEVFGGLILIVIGLKILYEHLFLMGS